ncbi:dickkopf-like protein 1 isoform X3 [Gopherus flavomarginatus]|uniref:dickkopf-like protein 1 isoform X3 n=1 Tax=Gopherus flavomarginatus TaxID=286002 RepID=UPI0021CBC54B|nr:dickkopf-like protein 1 isoform X3 [Gopherus flavomarginatus]
MLALAPRVPRWPVVSSGIRTLFESAPRVKQASTGPGEVADLLRRCWTGRDGTGAMWARWLLLCTLGALLAGAGGSLLPPAARRLLGRFHHLLGGSRVTDNETGAMLFSDRTVTSIEQGERGLAERWRGSQAESGEEGAGGGAEAEPVLGRHILPIPRPGLAFLIIHLRRRTRPGKASDTSWPDGASLSDRRHRLLAIRNGLMEAPHPLKKAPPITQAQHKAVARRPHFFFFFRKL